MDRHARIGNGLIHLNSCFVFVARLFISIRNNFCHSNIYININNSSCKQQWTKKFNSQWDGNKITYLINKLLLSFHQSLQSIRSRKNGDKLSRSARLKERKRTVPKERISIRKIIFHFTISSLKISRQTHCNDT